jgi:RNA polymerase sigma factor (sigma-70 family)
MVDGTGTYLKRIGRVALLTVEEERRLGAVVQEGLAAERQQQEDPASCGADHQDRIDRGRQAQREFLEANLRLVVSIARRFPLPPGIELLDLVQEGNVGLARAVVKFDPARGFKFSTYASFWIRQAIGRSLDQTSTLIKIPGDRSAALRTALRQDDGTLTSLSDAQRELHVLSRCASLDQPLDPSVDRWGPAMGDLVADDGPGPEDDALAHDRKRDVYALVAQLPPRPRAAVALRFGLIGGDVTTYDEVGRQLGITGEAARRLVVRTLDRLTPGRGPPT